MRSVCVTAVRLCVGSLMFVFMFCLRNKMVEYLTDWVMGTSNQAADDDVKCLTRYGLLI